MSNENEEIDKTSNAKDSPFMRKVKGYAVGIASLVSSVSGLAQNQPNELPQQDKEPVAQETTYVAPQTEKDDNTYVFNEKVLDLAEKRMNTNETPDRRFSIGEFDNDQLTNPDRDISYNINTDVEVDVHDKLVTDVYEASTKEEYASIIERRNNAFAYCSASEYNLPTYKISGDFEKYIDSILENPDSLQKLQEKNPYDLLKLEYLKNNPIAKIMVSIHEVEVHGYHQTQQENLISGFSPYMGAVRSDMTEKIADAGEYLALAMIYGNCKEAGIDTLMFEDRAVPLDNILEYKAGLKDIVDKYGYDIHNSEFLTKVAECSSKNWDTHRAEPYTEQAIIHADEGSSLIEMIVQARNWEKTKNNMIVGIDILGQKVNFPQECMKYFHPSDERINNIFEDWSYVTNESLLKIDKYLDNLGLKNDSDKAEYIELQANKINKREGDADLNLRNLLISATNDGEGSINYSDDISQDFNKDGTSVIRYNGFRCDRETRFVASTEDLDNIKNSPKNAQELKETLSKIVVTPEKLSPEQVLSNDLANITVKTEDAKTNQINLDMIKLTQIDR